MLTLNATTHGPHTVLTATGTLAAHTAAGLTTAVHHAAGTGRVVLDVDGLHLADGTALAALVAAHRTLAGTGRTLHLLCTRPRTLRLLRVSAVSKLLPVLATLDDLTA